MPQIFEGKTREKKRKEGGQSRGFKNKGRGGREERERNQDNRYANKVLSHRPSPLEVLNVRGFDHRVNDIPKKRAKAKHKRKINLRQYVERLPISLSQVRAFSNPLELIGVRPHEGKGETKAESNEK